VATSTYHVILKRDAAKALQAIPTLIAQQARGFIDTHLQHHPTQRIPSKLKQLKGSLTGIWQYDLPSSYRLWYRVDPDAQVVSVIYIGPHP
jgi:mRNA-degrading endonuclease RelE of RelBE toxin-antitoxin system